MIHFYKKKQCDVQVGIYRKITILSLQCKPRADKNMNGGNLKLINFKHFHTL